MPLRIDNRTARHLWLDAQGLSKTPTGPLVLGKIIEKIGFVQLDTINNVTRAHHHILWSRNQNYREPMLDRHLAAERGIFEHFTHDASVLPMAFYPFWQRQFRRLGAKIERSNWYKTMPDEDGRRRILDRIAQEGPLSTQAFDTKIDGERQMWDRPPHKLALDYFWYNGTLSTSHRQDFRKFYDLTNRVIPDEYRQAEVDDEAAIDWLCENALHRLAFGSTGDLKRFWDAMDMAEAKTWAETRARNLVPLEIECADKSWLAVLGAPDIEARIAAISPPTTRLRILNPFDPVIRDRKRLERLFGFDYRIEIFVPAAKRQWGYYVYPIMEGDRFVGRIELKAERKRDILMVQNFWPEPSVKWTRTRFEKMEAELMRFARLGRVSGVDTAGLSA